MYAIALMIHTEILICLVLSGKDCAFNHAYIQIVRFIGFNKLYWFKYIGTSFING